MKKLISSIFKWFDKRYVISDRAQRSSLGAQATGEPFDSLYERSDK